MPQSAAYRAFIALGGNIGDVRATLKRAAALVAELGKNLQISPLYQTKPEGFLNQPDFLNCVLSIDTELTPNDLLTKLQQIEAALGRHRTFKNAPRTIDIDIISCGVEIDTPTLKLPHPRAHMREFVLRPLCDIAPDIKLKSGATGARQMLADIMQAKQTTDCLRTDW